MKYVAFLDILGYKEKLKSLSQENAIQFISAFSNTIYQIWDKDEQYKDNLDGYIVSDSLIISTKNTGENALTLLLIAINEICRNEFKENSTLIRGGIAKGEYERLRAAEFESLGKGLIVGQAYVDAYLLEGAVKSMGVVLSADVYDDYRNLDGIDEYSIAEENMKDKKLYNMYYLTLDFLLKDNNLKTYIGLASSSNWIPHYYNTLYFLMKNQASKKISSLFDGILQLTQGDNPSENWRNVDLFIKNAFDENVMQNFQIQFLKYLRGKIQIGG